MRNLLIALLVVGFLAAPSMAVINIAVSTNDADNKIAVGDSITVYVSAQGTAAGIYSIGGSTVASGTAGALATDAGSGVWVPLMVSPPGFPVLNGNVGANGGMAGFGSEQNSYLFPDANYAKASLVQMYSYTAKAMAPGVVTLDFVSGAFSGYKPTETNKATVLGTLTPVSITITPEPVTMALLAVGGLLVARRRR